MLELYDTDMPYLYVTVTQKNGILSRFLLEQYTYNA